MSASKSLVRQASVPEFHGCSGRAKRVIAWVWGSVRHGNAIVDSECSLRTLPLEGMQLHVLVACTLVELHQAFQRRKPERWACRVARVFGVGWFRLIQDLDTSLVELLRGTCNGLVPPEGGIVCGLVSKEGQLFWEGISKSDTLSISGRTSHRTYPVPVSSWSQRCKQTPVSTSQAQVMGSSLSSPPSLKR